MAVSGTSDADDDKTAAAAPAPSLLVNKGRERGSGNGGGLEQEREMQRRETRPKNNASLDLARKPGKAPVPTVPETKDAESPRPEPVKEPVRTPEAFDHLSGHIPRRQPPNPANPANPQRRRRRVQPRVPRNQQNRSILPLGAKAEGAHGAVVGGKTKFVGRQSASIGLNVASDGVGGDGSDTDEGSLGAGAEAGDERSPVPVSTRTKKLVRAGPRSRRGSQSKVTEKPEAEVETEAEAEAEARVEQFVARVVVDPYSSLGVATDTRLTVIQIYSPQGQLAKAGIKIGDRIVAAGRKMTSRIPELEQALDLARVNGKRRRPALILTVLRRVAQTTNEPHEGQEGPAGSNMGRGPLEGGVRGPTFEGQAKDMTLGPRTRAQRSHFGKGAMDRSQNGAARRRRQRWQQQKHVQQPHRHHPYMQEQQQQHYEQYRQSPKKKQPAVRFEAGAQEVSPLHRSPGKAAHYSPQEFKSVELGQGTEDDYMDSLKQLSDDFLQWQGGYGVAGSQHTSILSALCVESHILMILLAHRFCSVHAFSSFPQERARVAIEWDIPSALLPHNDPKAMLYPPSNQEEEDREAEERESESMQQGNPTFESVERELMELGTIMDEVPTLPCLCSPLPAFFFFFWSWFSIL